MCNEYGLKLELNDIRFPFPIFPFYLYLFHRLLHISQTTRYEACVGY
jgi:hypothetical protein